MARPKKYSDADEARAAQIDNQREYNKTHYDRISVRIKKDTREKLIDHMSTKLSEIQELEKMQTRTPKQEQHLKDLKELYTYTKTGTPSMNSLIIALLKRETGIQDF